jgi:hypothetical protein
MMSDRLYSMYEIQKSAKEMGAVNLGWIDADYVEWVVKNNHDHMMKNPEVDGNVSVIGYATDKSGKKSVIGYVMFRQTKECKNTCPPEMPGLMEQYRSICINGMPGWQYMMKLDPNLFPKREDSD